MNDTKPKYKDKDWLREQYWTRFRSVPEIAEKCSVTKSTVYRWMHNHDIPVDHTDQGAVPKQDQLPPADVLEALHWGDRLPIVDIADASPVGPKSVINKLERNGVSTRGQPTGKDNNQYVPDEELLDDIIAGYVLLGEWPSSVQQRRYGEHSPTTIYNHFGSWDDAVEAAKERYSETEEQWPDPEAV